MTPPLLIQHPSTDGRSMHFFFFDLGKIVFTERSIFGCKLTPMLAMAVFIKYELLDYAVLLRDLKFSRWRRWRFKFSGILRLAVGTPQYLRTISFNFIYSHSIDHTDVEYVIKYKCKQLLTTYKYKLQIEKSMSAWNSCSKPFCTNIYKERV